MHYFDKNQKLEYLLKIIDKQNTGTACQLAEHICASVPTLHRYLALLREKGHKIGFCSTRKTYYFIDK